MIRIRKVPNNGSKSQGVRNTIALTPHERLIWKDVHELISSSDKEIAGQLFVQHVMEPLLGAKYVDSGVCDYCCFDHPPAYFIGNPLTESCYFYHHVGNPSIQNGCFYIMCA